MEVLTYPFMIRALVAAVFTGLAAPAVGTYLVQRRLALMGDGIGHIAVTGVALGLLTGTSPTLTAVIVAILGSVLIEVIREKGRTSGDVALALLFYGGIAGGVLLTGLADQSAATLNGYLFGSITSISWADVWVTVALATVVIAVSAGLSPQLFAVAHAGEQPEDLPHEKSMQTPLDKMVLQTARRAPRFARAGVRIGNAIQRRRARAG